MEMDVNSRVVWQKSEFMFVHIDDSVGGDIILFQMSFHLGVWWTLNKGLVVL